MTGAKAAAIAESFTAESALSDSGRWTGYRVRQMLGNPAMSAPTRSDAPLPLKTHRLRRPPSQWVEAKAPSRPSSRKICSTMPRRSSPSSGAHRDTQMLEELSTLARTRRLTAQVIDDAPDLSSAKSYAQQFAA